MSTTTSRTALAAVLLTACADDTGSNAATTQSDSSGGTTSAVATHGSDGVTGTQGDATSAPDTTADVDTGTPETSTATSAEDDTGPTTGPGEVKLCTLEAIDSTADPSTVIDAGDQAGQIPTAIGDALIRNCGCHYTDEVAPGYTDYISNAAPMSTWADFHANFEGVFPAGFAERLTWEACEVRVIFNLPLPMPPKDCDIDGTGTRITDEDFVLFAQWFEAGAPDGASWP